MNDLKARLVQLQPFIERYEARELDPEEVYARINTLKGAIKKATHELDRFDDELKEKTEQCDYLLDQLQLQQDKIIKLLNVEEKAIAIVRYMRGNKPDGVMSVITELGLLYPPEEKEKG